MAGIEDIKDNKILRNIKSPYILETVFSFLEESQKLDIIIYNMELQKKCLININD